MRFILAIPILAIAIDFSGCRRAEWPVERAVQDVSVAGDHPFTEAVKRGHSRAAHLWLQKGQNPNTRDSFGVPVLNTAAATRQADLVQDLLDRGADPNAADRSGATALIQAARAGAEEVVATLLAKGAAPDRKDSSGGTALMGAARAGAAGIVRVLLLNHAHLNDQDSLGRSALLAAAEAGRSDIVGMLVSSGADVNARSTKDGNTAVVWAAMAGRTRRGKAPALEGRQCKCQLDQRSPDASDLGMLAGIHRNRPPVAV